MRDTAHARTVRALGSLAIALLASLVTRPGYAYYEDARVTSDDVRVTVDGAAVARVEHALVWHVLAGQPHGFDLAGVEPTAEPEPVATLEADDGRVLSARVTLTPDHHLHVVLDEPRGARHGQRYQVHLAYGVNLALAGELVRDGGEVRVMWRSAVPANGYEAAKVTFVLRPALEAPGAFFGDGGMRDDGALAKLTRAPDHDEVEILRPHVGRGEEVIWAVRLSAKAFDALRGAPPSPLPLPPRREPPSGPKSAVYAVIALLAVAYAALVLWKHRRFDAQCRRIGASVAALVPLPPSERAAAAGATVFAGLSLQLVAMPLVGACLVVFATVCAALRPSRVSAAPRGPGRWLLLRPDEAFARVAVRDSFDVTSPRGAALLLGSLLLWSGLTRGVLALHPGAPMSAYLDAVALVPIFATGLVRQLPPDRAGRRPEWLAGLFRRLRRTKSLRVSPMARLPTAEVRPDEVRVLVMPRAPIPGLAAIEVGLAWGRAQVAFVDTPEVLVRVHEETAASARLTTVAPGVVPVPGRTPEERVYRLSPRAPTAAATLALVRDLAHGLVDRRRADTALEHEERRGRNGGLDVAVHAPSPAAG